MLTPLKNPSPPGTVSHERIINRIGMRFALAAHAFRRDYSIEWLEDHLREALRSGHLSISTKAVDEAIRDDDVLADKVLREVGAELQATAFSQRDLLPGHVQILAYTQRALNRSPLKRNPGRSTKYDLWVRNICICIMIRLVHEQFGIKATRNPVRRGPRFPHCAVSLVKTGLARGARIHLDEGTITKDLWFGLFGEIARTLPPKNWFAL